MSMGVISMRLCAISLGWLSRQVISKQALAQRLTSASAAFVKAVMLQEFQRQSRLGRQAACRSLRRAIALWGILESHPGSRTG